MEQRLPWAQEPLFLQSGETQTLGGGTVLIMRAHLVKKPKHEEPSEHHQRGKMWGVELVGRWSHHPWTMFLGGGWFAKVGWGAIILHSFGTNPSGQLQGNKGQRVNPRQGFTYPEDERSEL